MGQLARKAFCSMWWRGRREIFHIHQWLGGRFHALEWAVVSSVAPALVNKYILSLHHTLRDKYYAKVRREAAKADGNGSSAVKDKGQ